MKENKLPGFPFALFNQSITGSVRHTNKIKFPRWMAHSHAQTSKPINKISITKGIVKISTHTLAHE